MPGDSETKVLQKNFRRVERREWWLWAAAFVITLLITVALASLSGSASSGTRSLEVVACEIFCQQPTAQRTSITRLEGGCRILICYGIVDRSV